MIQPNHSKKNSEKEQDCAQFLIDRKTLLSALQAVQPMCSRRTTMEVTSNVLMQVSSSELVLKATDLEMSFQASFQIEANVTDNLQFTVHAKRLMDLIRDLGENLSFSWNGKSLSISSDENHDIGIVLTTGPADNFPPFPEKIENLIDINASFLRSAINQVDQLIPSNNANPALNGLLVQFDDSGLCFVATDGHSLAKVSTSKYLLSESREWIIPKKAVTELKKTLEISSPERVFLGTCSNQLVFSGGNFNFFTRLISDKFPDYKPVLQRDGFFSGEVDRNLLCASLRRAVCLLAGKFISSKFSFTENLLEISLDNKEVGSLQEKIPLISFDGIPVTSNFYPPYILNALSQVPQEQIQFAVKGGTHPLFFDFSAEEFNTTYLIMPVISSDTSDLA